ncbi:MAG TPA: GFA family protein [Rubrivivax sp.]
MKLRIASCNCGQLSTRVTGEPIRVSVCHCFACQRRTGSVFGAQARFLREAVEINGAGTEYVRIGDEGGRSKFTFCPVCGATVFYVMEGREDSIAIPVGAFADSSFPAPTFSVYEDRKHSWVTMPRDIEHMA